MKSVRVEKIDALITSLESAEVPVEGVNYYDWQIVNEVIETLRGLRKELTKDKDEDKG